MMRSSNGTAHREVHGDAVMAVFGAGGARRRASAVRSAGRCATRCLELNPRVGA
jgi:hypothetical protein